MFTITFSWPLLESGPTWLMNMNVPKCVFKLKCRFEKVNKTHEIINKKMAPPFCDIILNSNKMNEFINLL